jgi:hypothetical protein
MSGVDQLRPEERAVIELVLRRGLSYAQIGRALNVGEDRARELAHHAVARLEPEGRLERPLDWIHLADYVLGQEPPHEADRTRAYLERSAPARAWVRSASGSLRPLFRPGDEPWVPPEPASPPAPRRRGPPLAAAVAFALVLLAGLVAVTALTGGGRSSGPREQAPDRAASPPGGRARVVGQVLLHGVAGSGGQGLAGVVDEGGRRRLVLQARLPRGAARGRYAASLANSRTDTRALAPLQNDGSGAAQGAAPLPADAGRFRFVEVVREDGQAPGRPGRSVLRGPLPR